MPRVMIVVTVIVISTRKGPNAHKFPALAISGNWEWLSDSPSLQPPCDGAVSYYSQFGRVMDFTLAAGRCFRRILDQHLDLLLWPNGIKASVT